MKTTPNRMCAFADIYTLCLTAKYAQDHGLLLDAQHKKGVPSYTEADVRWAEAWKDNGTPSVAQNWGRRLISRGFVTLKFLNRHPFVTFARQFQPLSRGNFQACGVFKKRLHGNEKTREANKNLTTKEKE